MLLGVYREKMQQSFGALEEAIAAGDLKQVALLAHSVKGSSSNFRFEAMTRLAESMEFEARGGNSALDYAGVLSDMQNCFNTFVAEKG
jgi:HPt (histidine-containing phosphotransfer) domain-containing protein